MGLEYKDNEKKRLGKTNILGNDVLAFGQTVASGIVGATALKTVGGTSKVTLPRGGVLQFITSDVGTAPSAGQINAQVKVNGVVIASGSHTSSSAAMVEWVFGHNQNFPKRTLASGDYIEADYSVNSIMSLGAVAKGSLVRVGIQYLE